MAYTTEPSLCSRYGKKFIRIIPSNLTIYEFSSSIISISQMRKLRQREYKESARRRLCGGIGILELHLIHSRVLALTHYPELDLDLYKHPLPTTQREDSTHGHHQMVNTEIRLIIFSAAKDGEAPYSQQKQDQELTVAQIMNSLLTNSDSN